MATGPKNPTDPKTRSPEPKKRPKRAAEPSGIAQTQTAAQAKSATTPAQATFYESNIPFIVVDPATIIAERPTFVSENDVYRLNRKLTTRLKHFNIQADPKMGFQELSRSLIKFFKENNTSEIDQLAITQEFRIANLELYHLYNGVATKEINANMINLANLQFSIIEKLTQKPTLSVTEKQLLKNASEFLMSNNEWVAKDSQIQAKIEALVKANPSLNFNGNFRAWDTDVLTEEANIYCLQRVNEYLKQHPNEISYAIDSAGHYVGNYNYNSLDGLKAINDLLATIISNEKNRFTQDQKKQLDSLLLKQSNLIIQYANESLKKILDNNIAQINQQDINGARQMLKTTPLLPMMIMSL